MKRIVVIYLVLILILGGIILYRSGFFTHSVSTQSGSQITIDNHTFTVTVAKTQADQVKGLSGKSSIPQDTGMLFVFRQKGEYPFWMKGMEFSLDLIYINDNKIVDIFQNVPPPAPNTDISKIRVYKPQADANYVLEINGGLSQTDNFKIGDTVTMKNIN